MFQKPINKLASEQRIIFNPSVPGKAVEPPPRSFGQTEVSYPVHLEKHIFAPFLRFKNGHTTAKCNYVKYSGKIHDLSTDREETDVHITDFENQCADKAVAEDAALGAGQVCLNVNCTGCEYCCFSNFRIGQAIRVDFLVALCFVLDLWDWSTKDVVIFLVKASTEELRCRFSMHPVVRAYTGSATVLMSHSWGN